MIRIIHTYGKTCDINTHKGYRLFPKTVTDTVREIISAVEENGDSAVRMYSELYDRLPREMNLTVSKAELEEACSEVEAEFSDAVKTAIANIRHFHKHQYETGWSITTARGSVLGNIITPLEKVAVYVPGGKAAYPSSVIMNVIPAQIAGVKDITLFTPPDSEGKVNKYVAEAARQLGIDKVYRVGGAQAVAAAALGTETIEQADKIVGPGNIYVAAAKKEVYGLVDIDMIAGPSEVLIIADRYADPEYAAADMLSQAEHDEQAKCILITDSYAFAKKVASELEKQLVKLERCSIATAAIENNSSIIVADSLMEAAELANNIAPEHLELLLAEPEPVLNKLRNAGAIFVGQFSTEPIGDYIAGPNHVLPTSGTARFYSPLSVKDFLKTTSLIRYSREDFINFAPAAILLAEKEGLTAHANAMKARLQKDG
ncbi:MAG: histidinol dehydrogenase [Bacillota bacterium]